jgi:peptide/nickel transport system permease protein
MVSSQKLQRVIRFCRQRPLGAIGGLIFLVMVFTAVLADWIAPYDPLVNDYAAMMSPPSMKHLMGTDAHGRDVFSRIIFGSRTALLVGFCSSFFGTSLGALIGVLCAYFAGKTDVIIQRFMEILLSFPLIVMALAMMAVLGTGLPNVIVAITIPMIPRSAQVIRSSALSIRNMPYVDAARASGFGHGRIMFRHILPNVAAPYLILVTAYLGGAILTEASLSFLGVGVAEPTAAWGLMLKGAAVTFAETAPWMAIFPGLAISAAVFAFNIFGDSLRDELDPKLRTSS